MAASSRGGLLEQSDWHEVQDCLEVRLVSQPDGEPGEKYVLCRSAARAEKERAMLQRQRDGLTAALVKIDAWLRRTPQTDLETVGRRIGRALGKSPSVAALVQARVQPSRSPTPPGARSGCKARDVAASQKFHQQKGAYLLRTNCEETDPAQLWRWYIQLVQAEAAFRTAKSDVGRCPIYHQLEDRVQAHLLVCFPALALWRTLEQWMHAKGLGTCARQLRRNIAGIKRMDVLLPAKRAELTTELHLRVVATPEPETAQLLAHLGLRLSKGPREIAEGSAQTRGLNRTTTRRSVV